MYRLRKLCTSLEEYEAFIESEGDIDLSQFSSVLEREGISERSLNPPQLTVFFEDIGVVARIYSSGMVHLLANDRAEAERVCQTLERALQSISRNHSNDHH